MFIDPIREMEAFLTTEEVLIYLRITPRTIYRLIRSGELPAVRIGRQWRFRPPHLHPRAPRQRGVFAPSFLIFPPPPGGGTPRAHNLGCPRFVGRSRTTDPAPPPPPVGR